MVQTLSIRTKLIMALLSLIASVALMAVTADDANAAGVTEIRRVFNVSEHEVYIWNHESGKRMHIAPGAQVSFNEWVPWATNANDFNRGKFIEIGYVETGQVQCGGVGYCARYAIWQENRGGGDRPDRIRWNAAKPLQYSSTAEPMPGAAYTGGRRALAIYRGSSVPQTPEPMRAFLFTTPDD